MRRRGDCRECECLQILTWTRANMTAHDAWNRYIIDGEAHMLLKSIVVYRRERHIVQTPIPL